MLPVFLAEDGQFFSPVPNQMIAWDVLGKDKKILVP